MPVLAGDDVVVHGDAERLRDVDDRLGHRDISLRGRRVAGGMVMQAACAAACHSATTEVSSDREEASWNASLMDRDRLGRNAVGSSMTE